MEVKSPENQKPYDDDATDVGKKIQVSGRVFEVVSAPDYTLCWMEANLTRFTQSDMQFSIETLKKYLQKTRLDFKAELRKIHSSQSGYIRKSVGDLLFSCHPGFSRQRAITIVRRFAEDNGVATDQLLTHLAVQ
jgi:hypothetical protein